jgi:leucyl aminopeptidase
MNGLTVEIENTDAEGRLVMADAMCYVQRNFKPKKVMYIATLTGAVMSALGINTAGYFTPHDEMAVAIKKASESGFESFWQLPLTEEHREKIVGRYGSDITNLGAGGFGGASQAAAFLENFIENDRPWAHLDIASGCLNHTLHGLGAKTLLNIINQM